MKIVTVLFLFLASFLNAQQIEVKQLTNVDGDAHNAAFFDNGEFININGFIFENHKSGSSNLYFAPYDVSSDLFLAPVQLTSGSYMDINPVTFEYDWDKFGAVFQTNRNGNWDIALIKNEEGNWEDIEFITESAASEFNPEIVYNYLFYDEDDTLDILFERYQSIYWIRYKDSVLSEELIFETNNSLTYSSQAGTKFYNYNNGGYYFSVAAVEEKITGEKKIVIKTKPLFGQWDPALTVEIEDAFNPQFYTEWHSLNYLTYEKIESSKIVTYYWQNWFEPGTPEKLKDYDKNVTDYTTDDIELITKDGNSKNSLFGYFPETFKVWDENSTAVRVNNGYHYYQSDTLISTKVKTTIPSLGTVGMVWEGVVYYIAWEDSVNGSIQIFGDKELIPIGAVPPSEIPDDFTLFQNYPNPFNPLTKIRFYLPKESKINLSLYNLVGEKIITIADEKYSAGFNEVTFIPKGLSSGVYFIRLNSSNYNAAVKVVYLK